jgi:hypothetical protein
MSPVDYTDYRTRDIPKPGAGNAEDLFWGILRYIFFKSSNRYNPTEIRFGYKSQAPNSDATSVLDPRTQTVFQSGVSEGEFLSVQFQRILVRPTSYAFRTGPNVRGGARLNSFVFQGETGDGHWITLDERNFPYDGPQHFAVRIYYVDTELFFSHFRIKITTGTSFALSGFEIHGKVTVREECALNFDMDSGENDDAEFDPYKLPEFDG